MSLTRDTLLLAIAAIAFGTWLDAAVMGGWPFAVTGLGIAAVGFLGSLVSAARSTPAGNTPADGGDA